MRALHARAAAGVAAIGCVMLISGLIYPAPAYAAQNYYSETPPGTFPAGIHDGTVTFPPSNHKRFIADATLQDNACDSAGIVGNFFVYGVTGGSGNTRDLYYGGGCGGFADFDNEVFNRASRIDRVVPVACLSDDGDIFQCYVGAAVYSPHT